MLDAPIRSGDRVVGVLCHEHVGGARGFQVDEQNTANLLDIDHFKRINDERGHQAGDDVLKAFAADVLGRLRRTDSVGRWGGFLLVLPETTREGAIHVLDELRAHVSRPREGSPSFTVSVGVAAFPDDGTELLPLVARADARLYEAKGAGRNCVR